MGVIAKVVQNPNAKAYAPRTNASFAGAGVRRPRKVGRDVKDKSGRYNTSKLASLAMRRGFMK